MSKTQEALKLALEALESCSTGDYSTGHVIHPSFDVDAVNKAIEAIDEALAEQPYPDNFIDALKYDVAKRDSEAQQAYEDAFVNGTGVMLGDKRIDPASIYKQPEPDNTYNYAKNLAEAMFKRHFASDEHYASGRIVWGVNDTVIGILTQIDNMVADMVRKPAQQQEPVAGWDSIEAMAAERYKVVPSHDSMFYRHAVVAGNGTQQLYIGREVECENMARKFAGAFLDGAFVMQSRTSPPASKPWVGLTEAEHTQIAVECGCMSADWVFYGAAVERKLREKNA